MAQVRASVGAWVRGRLGVYVGGAVVALVAVLGACSPAGEEPQAAVLSVAIDQSDVTLVVGEVSDPLTATVVAAGGADAGVVWSSGAPGVATVDPGSGVVMGVSLGSAAVVASSTFDPSRSDAIVVTVVAAPAVLGVSIDQGDVGLVVGETIGLTATVDVAGDASPNVTWSSGNEAVATVDAATGEVTAQGVAGQTADITATSVADATVSDTVTVTLAAAPVVIDSVTIEAGDFVLQVGTTTTLSATVAPAGAPQDVSWSSSDDAVATVNENSGEVTGVAVGTANITATSAIDGTVSDTIEVTVLSPPVASTADLVARMARTVRRTGR